MKKIRLLVLASFVALLIMSIKSVGYSSEKPYKTKADVICGDAKVEIATEYKVYSPNTPPDCIGQNLTIKDISTGKKIVVSSSGMPFDKILDNACATNYQCLKGKIHSYLILVYNTGGNCEECEWQGILDLKGNRIAVDRYKKQKASFSRKWKELGLPSNPKRGIDFETIPDE